MVTAIIEINQAGRPDGVPGQSRDDLVLAVAVNLTNSDNVGVVSWNWRLLAAPAGSAARLTNPLTPLASFVPDVAGSYLIQLLVNGHVKATAIAAVKTAFLALRIPAKGETTELNGWESAIQEIIGQLETSIASGGGETDRYLVFSDDTQFAETGTSFATKKTFRIIRDPNHPPVRWRAVVSLWVSAPGTVAECMIQAVGTGGTDTTTLTQVSNTSETPVYGFLAISNVNEPVGSFVSMNIRLRKVSGPGTVYLQYTDIFALQS